MLEVLDRTVPRIAWALAAVAGGGLILIAILIMAEVIMRTGGDPLVGVTEIVRVIFVVSVFFAFANVIVSERDIRVDAFIQLLPAPVRRSLNVAASMITIALFSFLLFFSIGRTYDAWTFGVFMEGRLLLPKWIPWGTIAIGSGMAVLGAILVALRQALSPQTSVESSMPNHTSVS